jgi:thiol-disulfide isomerase/thioredoxin
MQKRLIAYAVLAATAAQAGITQDVRSAISTGNFGLGESLVESYRKQHGATPEMAEALSWLGRGALDRREYDRAEAYADRAYSLGQELLKKQPLDSDGHLALAVGAAIEVRAQVMTARGERDQAVGYLRKELAAFRGTSIRTRIQKNINLLSLEGKPAPPLQVADSLGVKAPTLTALRGTPVLLFFWAHWCGDCKAQLAVLARLKSEYGPRLRMEAPTQLYGYVARGEEAPPPAERKYIGEVWGKYYASFADVPVPIGSDNFRNYGASTTPTLVLIDSKGVVRLYHPGNLSYDELRQAVAQVIAR